MAISCVVEYPEDYCHERFYGITPAKRYVSMGYQGRSPWLVSSNLFLKPLGKYLRACGQPLPELGVRAPVRALIVYAEMEFEI
jgi:hypothetical protein